MNDSDFNALLDLIKKDNANYLDVSKQSFTESQFIIFVDAIANTTKLKSLVWAGSRVETRLLPKLFTAVRQSQIVLFQFTETGIKQAQLASFSEMLERSAALQAIIFSENRLGVQNLNNFMASLSRNLYLKIIDLSHNQVNDALTERLVKALQSNTSLEVLRLGHNVIGDDGGVAISKLLAGHSSLVTLFIHDNQIGNRAAIKLFDALKKNVALRVLRINNNSLGKGCIDALVDSLTSNTSLRTIFLQNNRFGNDAVDTLLFGLRSNIYLRHLGLTTPTESQKKDREQYLQSNSKIRQLIEEHRFPVKALQKKIIELLDKRFNYSCQHQVKPRFHTLQENMLTAVADMNLTDGQLNTINKNVRSMLQNKRRAHLRLFRDPDCHAVHKKEQKVMEWCLEAQPVSKSC